MKIFVTGTDTGIGKTYVSVALMKAWQQCGLSTLGLKPVASGVRWNDGKKYNEDARLLQEASSIKLPYEKINPFLFDAPIAPHIAAMESKTSLSVAKIYDKVKEALQQPAEFILIEGVGGLLTPLNQQETMADFISAHTLPTLLVVGMRLGCLNHAMLTARSIVSQSILCLGWIANQVDPAMSHVSENIAALKTWLPFPYLGAMRHNDGDAFLSIAQKMTAIPA